MSESLFSQSWYRVAPLKPRLRSHVRIYRHQYRGEDWYVIQDQFTGRHHRFSPEAYQLIGLMDGRRTLGEIWVTACGRLGDHMPTQDEVIGLVSQLHRSDLLQTCALPDFADLKQRLMQGRRNRWLTPLLSPMAVRFPLLDPDRFLSRTMPLVNPLLSWPALLVWLVVVMFGGGMAVSHWTDLTNNLSDKLFGLENLFLISLIYPLLKVVHEFGHAYMVKKWGGEVHEMGIMLLVFMPIPYVEASSSLAFRDKKKRMLVGAAGILVEMFIAAVAVLLWLEMEPGAVRAATFNVMLIAGVSTVLFNGNPLLRFDAYYVLADALEIPNLGQRSTAYLSYLAKRYLLGVRSLTSPASTDGEAGWLAGYALASFVYRIFISLRIILFVAGNFFMFGVVLALWAAIGLVVLPVGKVLRYLIKDGEMRRKRMRIVGAVVVPTLALIAFISLVPMPFSTVCQGVTWAPDDAQVHAAVDGFVGEFMIPSGQYVAAGTPLLRCEDPQLDAHVRLLKARQKEYQARYNVSLLGDRTEAALLKEAMAQVTAELHRAEERRQALTIYSRKAGVFVVPQPENIIGHFARRGAALGYLVDESQMQVRVLVAQADIDRVRADTQRVECRLAQNVGDVVEARVLREVPAASRELPSLALSLEGGGLFALDPREKDRAMAVERLFQFELALPKDVTRNIDERVFVRFVHQPEPLIRRAYRAVRRVLLSRFAV
ncbi:efflux RND transporter periplasmic adaptor subunit [Desulfuromonas acetoxidans]|uniref:efflux RND transporter periplasmic adaptor subunit n=1 Tax=Desulfuromonas acetoxidans TaxID=891 RepID=UPI00292CCE91|nr:efflux RND transporter periplasmic adaptor subunit [Desulfuromonas acetoxidans]